MSCRLIIRPEAESDLAEAFEWYEQRRPGLGESLLLSVEATLVAIQETPSLFPEVHRNIRRALRLFGPRVDSSARGAFVWVRRNDLPAGGLTFAA